MKNKKNNVSRWDRESVKLKGQKKKTFEWEK